MKNIKNNTHLLLESYSRNYQIRFKFYVNQNIIFDNFNEEIEGTIYNFKIKNDDAKLMCSKKDFQKELEIISIALVEMMQEEDIHSLFTKGLNGQLTSYEKESFMGQYSSNQYSILLIETKHHSEHFYEILQSMIPYPMCEFVSQKSIAVLLHSDIDTNLIMEIKDTLEAELYCRVYIATSSLMNNLDDLQKGYEEANLYLNLMKKYDVSTIYANQKDCLLPYIVDSISEDKASLMLSRVDRNTFNQMDEELLNTIQVFLRNNLSIAETSRQLYLHRNTLIYRLDKIMNITGLDIRNFKDAIKMEILLLLKKRFDL